MSTNTSNTVNTGVTGNVDNTGNTGDTTANSPRVFMPYIQYSQHTNNPGLTYAYMSPHFAEFYDLWTTHLFGPPKLDFASPDLPPYAEFFRASAHESIRVLDIGTGTGSILRSLVSCDFSGTGLNPDIEFIGLDHSLAMLAQARDNWVGGPISPMWIEGSATQIPEELNDGVDLAIFAAGSVGHLLDIENDVVPFLRSLRRVLKQRGVACVSILTEFIEGEDTSEVDFGGTVELRSGDGKRTYKKRETRHEWKGNIKKEFFVAELREDGKVTWEDEIGWKLRRWKTEEWEQLLKDAGFDWVVRDVGEERWYSLRKKLCGVS